MPATTRYRNMNSLKNQDDSRMQPLSSYTLADPKIMQDPYLYYERLRAEDPVHFDEGIQTWLVTRYEDIVAVARNSAVYSDEMRVSNAIRSPFQAEVNDYMKREGFVLLDGTNTFKIDGEEHTRRRKLVAPAFTGSTVAQMEARVAAVCRDKAAVFLGRAAADGRIEVDLVKDYATPIPILVICDALGLPMDRVDEISRAADSMVARAGAGGTREVAYQHANNVMQLQRFVRQAIEERRDKPGTDLISQIVHARIDDPNAPQLTDKEVMSISAVAVAGGVDTTRNGIAFGLYTLATQPGLLARLRESEQQDKDIGRFNDEVLRFYSPVPQLPRVTKVEAVLGGKTIPQGANVFLCWASANRDPQRFTDPDKFDMDRANLNHHLAFGTGAHHCIGAMLARQEMKCAIREIVNRVESLELAVSPEQLDMSSTMVILRSLSKLPVRVKVRGT
jgi:cytochrome P450